MYWLIGHYLLAHRELAPYYDWAFLELFQGYLALLLVAWAVLAAVTLAARKRYPDAPALAHVTIHLYSIANAFGAYCVGPVTSPYLIVLLGAAVIGFVLFPARTVWMGLASATTVLSVCFVLRHNGIIPYAPLLAAPPYIGGEISIWWGVEMWVVALSIGLLVILLFARLMSRLRDRETRLAELARTDALTGVANRRHFLDVFAREYARAERYGTALACVLVDLDRFKQVNDDYGHLAGDHVLVAATRLLRQHLRQSDLLARYGGEEFVLILPETDTAGAHVVAERCRRSLAETPIDLGNGKSVTITGSAGIASMPHPRVRRVDDLLRLADDALAQAKNAGRNRIVLAA